MLCSLLTGIDLLLQVLQNLLNEVTAAQQQHQSDRVTTVWRFREENLFRFVMFPFCFKELLKKSLIEARSNLESAKVQTNRLNERLSSVFSEKVKALKSEEEQQKHLQRELDESRAKQNLLAKEVKQLRSTLEAAIIARNTAKNQYIEFQDKLRNLTGVSDL